MAFLQAWQLLAPDYPKPEQEYTFHPKRKWRFDFAWKKAQLCVEMEGGIWSRGRHVRGQGYIDDMEKYNAAALLGWCVLRYHQVTPDTIKQVKQALDKRLEQAA